MRASFLLLNDIAMNDTGIERPIPWFREAMVWLLILIPAAAFAAGLITLILAFRHADPEVAHVEQPASHRSQ